MNLSVCMIIKNEENYLDECLFSINNIADEIIIVDTGSTDNSLKIAQKYNSKIYHFNWINDFSAARNFSISKASAKWILCIDADERLNEESKSEIIKIIQSEDLVGYSCNVVSINTDKTVFNSKLYRLFKNSNEIKFTGKVHEQILPSLQKNGYQIRESNIKIKHLGYDVEHDIINQKARRNLKLIEENFEENKDWYSAYHAGQTLIQLEDIEKAKKYFEYVVSNNNTDVLHKADSFRFLAALSLKTKKLDEAENYLVKGLKLNPNNVGLHFVNSFIYEMKNDYLQAINSLEKVLELNSKKNQEFQLSFPEKEIFIRGINFSILLSNKEKYNLFFKKYLSFDKSFPTNYLLIFVNAAINNNLVDFVFNQNAEVDFEIIDKNVLLNYLNSSNNQEVLAGAYKLFIENINDSFMLRSLAEIFLSKGLNSFVKLIYKKIFDLYFDLSDLMQLIPLQINDGDIQDAYDYVKIAKEKHLGNQEVIEKLNLIEQKLKSVL